MKQKGFSIKLVLLFIAAKLGSGSWWSSRCVRISDINNRTSSISDFTKSFSFCQSSKHIDSEGGSSFSFLGWWCQRSKVRIPCRYLISVKVKKKKTSVWINGADSETYTWGHKGRVGRSGCSWAIRAGESEALSSLSLLDGDRLNARDALTAFLSLCGLSSCSLPACLLASNAPVEEQGRGSFAAACVSLNAHVNICKPQRKSIPERRNSSNRLWVHSLFYSRRMGDIKVRAYRTIRRTWAPVWWSWTDPTLNQHISDVKAGTEVCNNLGQNTKAAVLFKKGSSASISTLSVPVSKCWYNTSSQLQSF